MRNLTPPFRFDLSAVVRRMRKLPNSVDGVSICLPFVSVWVKPQDVERVVAREESSGWLIGAF